MFKIETGNKMSIINGDSGYFDVIVENYIFVDGDEITFTVAEKAGYRQPLIQKTLIKGEENLDENGNVIGYFNEDGSCTFILYPEDTAKRLGSFVYDVQLNLANGHVDTIIGPSTLTVTEGVTHRKYGTKGMWPRQ